jgi:hypothetical protein
MTKVQTLIFLGNCVLQKVLYQSVFKLNLSYNVFKDIVMYTDIISSIAIGTK